MNCGAKRFCYEQGAIETALWIAHVHRRRELYHDLLQKAKRIAQDAGRDIAYRYDVEQAAQESGLERFLLAP